MPLQGLLSDRMSSDAAFEIGFQTPLFQNPNHSRRVVIALVESPQVCSLKFLTCERGSVYRLAGCGGGAAQGFGGSVVV
ncbi:MAG: hypothetical protein ACLPLP_07895, partial [Mycobacterium sp.]